MKASRASSYCPYRSVEEHTDHLRGQIRFPVAGENGGCVADQEDEQRPGGDAPCRKAERSGPVAEPYVEAAGGAGAYAFRTAHALGAGESFALVDGNPRRAGCGAAPAAGAGGGVTVDRHR